MGEVETVTRTGNSSVTEAGHLVAIVHSRPQGSCAFTRGRVDIARAALGCASATVVNLYPEPLANVNELTDPSDEIWTRGRHEISRELHRPETTDVLLGYGVQTPAGSARSAFRSQLAWLAVHLTNGDARVWTYGDRPSHPSRRHRIAHRHDPDAGVAALASTLLTRHQRPNLLGP